MNALRKRSNDDGIAIVTVIGVAAIGMIVAIAIASSAIAASSTSTSTRAGVQSRAAADAAIDVVWASIAQGNFVCAAPEAAGIEYTASVEYFDEDGDALTCTGVGVLNGTPARAVVTSSGTANDAGILGNDGQDERDIVALFDIVVNSGTVNLDEAVFSDASTVMNNDVRIIDSLGMNTANVYSNGTVECKTQSGVQGNVYVQGDFTAPNRCVVNGTVWAGGVVTSADQLVASGDILAAGPGPVSGGMNLDKTSAGGSIVANATIRLNTETNQQFCPLAGINAKACGNVVSIEGSVELSNNARVGGSVLARNTVALGSTNNNLTVGGNVVSSTGNVTISNPGNSGERVRGYVAAGGSSQVPIARVGNKASSCAGSGTGYVRCSPAQPPLPLTGLPAVLNFPTETRVVAPPKESLPRFNSDAGALDNWRSDGWVVENVACNQVFNRLNAGWTGKLLVRVTDCAANSGLSMNNTTITMPGDLTIMVDQGMTGQNDVRIRSNNSTVRSLNLIVPSDAKRGANDLVQWTMPIASDPNYTRPTCVGSPASGNLRFSKMELTNVETFIYTPCTFEVTNTLTGFRGQMYSGGVGFPNNSNIVFVKRPMVGASQQSGAPTGVDVTQLARFDSRG